MNDTSIVRSAAELERKYLSKIAGLSTNIETHNDELIRVQNELTNMLNTLIINLGDVLDDNISLWFYPGIPTTSNLPYTSWAIPSEHIGDIYYDQNSGNVYKYTSNGWVQNTDTNLISAMALTNAELDVSTDHERKVYISQPNPPYDSGDWWILEDGTLKICQLGKESGEYDINDFVVSSKYVTTVATKQNDTITVLKGTVTEITEDYVKYTDLSTGGSTTIAGENITTGSIKSNNYVLDTSGTSINLIDGKISTKNVKIDDDGMKLSNGAKVVGNNGLMNSYLFQSGQKQEFCGYEFIYDLSQTSELETKYHKNLTVNIIIPQGLSITKATVKLIHTPFLWNDGTWMSGDSHNYWGWCRSLKLYKATNLYSRYGWGAPNAAMFDDYDTTYSEISGAFGNNGWTPSQPTTQSHQTQEITSIDIKNQLSIGLNSLVIKEDESDKSWQNVPQTDAGYLQLTHSIAERKAMLIALVNIEGYMTYS